MKKLILPFFVLLVVGCAQGGPVVRTQLTITQQHYFQDGVSVGQVEIFEKKTTLEKTRPATEAEAKALKDSKK